MLQSPLLPGDSDHCHMRFFYYMAGVQVGHLRLRMRLQGDTGPLAWKTVWWRTGWKGTRWEKVDVTLNADRPFHMRFLGRPKTYITDNDEIAIDDISFMPCSEETSEILWCWRVCVNMSVRVGCHVVQSSGSYCERGAERAAQRKSLESEIGEIDREKEKGGERVSNERRCVCVCVRERERVSEWGSDTHWLLPWRLSSTHYHSPSSSCT